MHLRLWQIVACLILSGWAISAAQACDTTKALPDGEVVTPIECAIDGLIQPMLVKLYLDSQDTLDTRLVSVELHAMDGQPVVKQTFEHWLAYDQVENMHARGLGGDVALVAHRERFAQSLPDAICATFDADAMLFFETGGSLQVVVTLRAVDKVRNVDASIEMADVTLHGCGVS
jgi:hypothetical protein